MLQIRQLVCLIFRGIVLMLLLAVAFTATQRTAYAYTDPGTGALIWQSLVAGAVGLSFYIRRIIIRLRRRKEEVLKD
jgi:O-antigen/teichoic acid export membrane protein